MAGILSREKNDKFTCKKFTARNRVQEMREIRQCILYDYVHFSVKHPPKILDLCWRFNQFLLMRDFKLTM